MPNSPLSFQLVMFVLQLGSATFLLTEPVISAMTTGAATHVVTSQVKYLLGIKMPYISGPLGFFYVSFLSVSVV
jgi:anion exchange transporter 7